MKEGLLLCGFDNSKQNRVGQNTNRKRFKDWYGSLPIVYAALWEDLQATTIDKARINEGIGIKFFVYGLSWLKKYQVMPVEAAIFNISKRTAQKYHWYFAHKIQALKEEKIMWPEEWNEGHPELNSENTPIYLVSVDGVHCRCFEPSHGEWSKNPVYYSTKFKQSALLYELALAVYENKLIWMNGPFNASTHDLTIFRG
jgi:hypothetical protein